MGLYDSYCLKSSWKWFFRHLLQTFFIIFLYHFLPVLYMVVTYPNTWFTRSCLAQNAHKSNKIYNKIQNIWFAIPIYSVLQLPKQCLRKNVVLLNFCLCVYTYYMCIKHNTRMIRLYRTSAVSKDLNNANWVTLIVQLYSVTMNNRNTESE